MRVASVRKNVALRGIQYFYKDVVLRVVNGLSMIRLSDQKSFAETFVCSVLPFICVVWQLYGVSGKLKKESFYCLLSLWKRLLLFHQVFYLNASGKSKKQLITNCRLNQLGFLAIACEALEF
jgi:hypothetical protein